MCTICRIENEHSEQNEMELMEDEYSEDLTLFWSQAIRGEGQKFHNADQFRRVLKNYCLSIRRGFNFVKNDSRKVIVKCSMEGCSWRIYASYRKSDESFGIRKCTLDHTCGPNNLQDR